MTQKILYRTDRNGTRYFHNIGTCAKCCGTGIIPQYVNLNGGECFECQGSGITEYDTKEMTVEYAAKIEAKRIAAQQKKIDQLRATAGVHNIEFLDKQGFNSKGETWVVLGDTYAIKDELKSAGASWSNSIGWHFKAEPKDYPSVCVLVDDIYEKDCTGRYSWNVFKTPDEQGYSAKIKTATENFNSHNSTSEYVGSIGDKVQLKLTVIDLHWFETSYGTTFVNILKDAKGNVYVWKTGRALDKGISVELSGVIKAQEVYNGIKQNILTRCKFIL